MRRISMTTNTGSLFNETDGINVGASIERWVEMVNEAIEERLPEYTLEHDVQDAIGHDRVRVLGADSGVEEDDVSLIVEGIIATTFERGDWVVYDEEV
jgi:hypothetical protein